MYNVKGKDPEVVVTTDPDFDGKFPFTLWFEEDTHLSDKEKAYVK